MYDRKFEAFGYGAAIGALGGLVGLGGAEFRLPVLIGVFGFAALRAVILNKAMSLVVIAFALVFRARTISLEAILDHWHVILNLLGGSLVGAWFGASWATRLTSSTLYRTIAVLLIVIAIALLLGHGPHGVGHPIFKDPVVRVVAGIVAGFGIGVVASLLGVAGGELLIPALIMLFGVEVKLAGSLSLAVSLPTMLVGFTRYSRDQSFSVLRQNISFLMIMATGSILGAFIGGSLLGIVPAPFLLPLLSLILVVSAVKFWLHK